MRNVVLVHGAWHGAWCWSSITMRLAARGIASVAVDLPGHGLLARSPQARWSEPFDAAAYATEISPVAGITASSAAAGLIEQLRAVGRGEPCVVVAHSMGGVVATAAAERAPELFAHLQYVTAFVPADNRSAADYLARPESAGELVARQMVADPAVVGALRVRTTDRESLRAAFYNGVDEDLADASIALLSSDFPAGIAAEPLAVTRERYGTVEHSYVVCGNDNAVRPALQRLMIDQIDAVSAGPTKVFELPASHSPFLSHPDELTDVITSVCSSGAGAHRSPRR